MVTSGVGQQVQVNAIVFGAEEDALAVVTPLGDMVGESGEYNASAARHMGNSAPSGGILSGIREAEVTSMSGLAQVKEKLSLLGFPPEPPVAEPKPPDGAQAARARASAAERTLVRRAPCGEPLGFDGGDGETRFPLVSSELLLRLPYAVWLISSKMRSLPEGFR